MKLQFLKHVTRFVAKNDNEIDRSFPGGPHVRMRLYVRVLPFLYMKTHVTFMHNLKFKLHANDLQKMVDKYLESRTK